MVANHKNRSRYSKSYRSLEETTDEGIFKYPVHHLKEGGFTEYDRHLRELAKAYSFGTRLIASFPVSYEIAVREYGATGMVDTCN